MTPQQTAAIVADVCAEDWPTVYGGRNPRALAVALWCHAWAESRFDARAVGDGGASFGLFQLYTRGGVGSSALAGGYTVADMLDPTLCTEIIVWACARSMRVHDVCAGGTLGDLVRVTTRDVLRPLRVDTESEERAQLVHALTRYSPATPCAALGTGATSRASSDPYATISARYLGGYVSRPAWASQRIGNYFTLGELTRTKAGYTTPNDSQLTNLRVLVRDVLDPLRAFLGRPVTVTSGLRPQAYTDTLKGGSDTSDHGTGRAADLNVAGYGSHDLGRAVLASGVPFDQLIVYDYTSHVHIGYRGTRSRRQLLRATSPDVYVPWRP